MLVLVVNRLDRQLVLEVFERRFRFRQLQIKFQGTTNWAPLPIVAMDLLVPALRN
jgi:hypothetical protein